MQLTNKKKTIIYIVKAVVFVVILFIILGGLSIIVRPKDNTKESETINHEAKAIYTEPEDTIDVVAMGASNFWCGYIPMQVWENTGITTYNCGTLMQEVWYSYYFLEEIFKTQTPKILLFDVDVLFLEDTTQIANVNSLITTALNWKLPVMEYHNRWKSVTGADITTEVKATNDNYMKGFYFVDAKESYEATPDYMDQVFDNQELTALNRFYMDKIKKLCEENGTKLVLLEAPAVRAWNHQRKNEILEYAQENNLEFLDANMADLGIDWTIDSRDAGYHLNFDGARKFTSYVEAYLGKDTSLTDHRQDPKYSKWNDDLKKYKEKTGTTD